MLLDILELFYKKQKLGESVSDKEALEILGRGEVGRWPAYVLLLEEQNLVKRTDKDEYVLVRNLSQVDFGASSLHCLIHYLYVRMYQMFMMMTNGWKKLVQL